MHTTEGRSTWGWTPREHARTALRLLDELENELRGGAGHDYPVHLLSAARRQLRLAVVALDSRRSSPSGWAGRGLVAHKRGWAVTFLGRVAGWGALAVGFALRWAWWYMRAVLRGLARG
jgi:hypothetical protein